MNYVPPKLVVVSSRLPVNFFNFADNEQITVSGVIDMKLVGQERRLRSLIDDVGAAASGNNAEASFKVQVELKGGSDAKDALGSSSAFMARSTLVWLLSASVVVTLMKA